MPLGMRSSLIALALSVGLATGVAAQEGRPASTWTDPPDRKSEPAKPAAEAPKPVTPGASSKADRPSGMAMSRRERKASRRPEKRPTTVAQAPRRSHHIARIERPVARSSRSVVAQAIRRPDARLNRPVMVYRSYPVYSAVRFPPDYEDERLDRLSTAVRSGYLVVHRRTVVYPDGRLIRFYRPTEDDGED